MERITTYNVLSGEQYQQYFDPSSLPISLGDDANTLIYNQHILQIIGNKLPLTKTSAVRRELDLALMSKEDVKIKSTEEYPVRGDILSDIEFLTPLHNVELGIIYLGISYSPRILVEYFPNIKYLVSFGTSDAEIKETVITHFRTNFTKGIPQFPTTITQISGAATKKKLKLVLLGGDVGVNAPLLWSTIQAKLKETKLEGFQVSYANNLEDNHYITQFSTFVYPLYDSLPKIRGTNIISNFIPRDISTQHIRECIFHHNLYSRVYYYNHNYPSRGNEYDHCYDCRVEIDILSRYLLTRNLDPNVDNISKARDTLNRHLSLRRRTNTFNTQTIGKLMRNNEARVPRDLKIDDMLITESTPSMVNRYIEGKFVPNAKQGQVKLLFSEILFLSLYYTGQPNSTILYIGAAPGHHLNILARLFPNISFITYDLSPMNIDSDLLPRFEIHKQLFKDEDTTLIRRDIKEKNLNLFLISDIRSNIEDLSEEEKEATIVREMYLQANWAETINPIQSLLKFRLPHHVDEREVINLQGLMNRHSNRYPQLPPIEKSLTMRYLDGILMKQVYGPKTTTECRLIPQKKGNSFLYRDYDLMLHQAIMFYHNFFIRPAKYQDLATQLNRLYITSDWDGVMAQHIIGLYLDKFGVQDIAYELQHNIKTIIEPVYRALSTRTRIVTNPRTGKSEIIETEYNVYRLGQIYKEEVRTRIDVDAIWPPRFLTLSQLSPPFSRGLLHPKK